MSFRVVYQIGHRCLNQDRRLYVGYTHHLPAGTRRDNNVFTTSTRRRRRRVEVVNTLSLRHYRIMCPLGSYDDRKF